MTTIRESIEHKSRTATDPRERARAIARAYRDRVRKRQYIEARLSKLAPRSKEYSAMRDGLRAVCEQQQKLGSQLANIRNELGGESMTSVAMRLTIALETGPLDDATRAEFAADLRRIIPQKAFDRWATNGKPRLRVGLKMFMRIIGEGDDFPDDDELC